MQNFPHHYKVKGITSDCGEVSLSSEGVTDITSALPKQFGGLGNRWSPESLLVAAVADCFILTFKAIARASKFDWVSLECDVEGILDKHNKTTMFIEFHMKAVLSVACGTNNDLAYALLEKSEHSCLITNSLSGKALLSIEVNDV